MRWTPETRELAAQLCDELESSSRAAVEFARRTGRAVPPNALRYAAWVHRNTAAAKAAASGRDHSSTPIVNVAPQSSPESSRPGARPSSTPVSAFPGADRRPGTDSPPRPDKPFAALVQAARAPGASVESVCNELDISPAKLERLVQEAQAAGVAVQVAHDTVAIRAAGPSDVPVDVAPISGEQQVVGAISDLHFGSKYCMRAQLRDFVAYAYAQGVREMLVSGDLLDGCYKHGRWELTHHGIDEQTDDAIESLPRHPGLTYHMISGNHDGTFTDANGVEVGPYIENRFRAAGRDDVRFYGNRGAYLRVRGALVHLWHPQGGVPYALSYRLQKAIEAYAPGLKPDILLTGHLHKCVKITTRGVHGLLVPCFQSPGSAFSNSLVGQPVNGGLILRWKLTAHGTLRSFSHEEVLYYHDERPRQAA